MTVTVEDIKKAAESIPSNPKQSRLKTKDEGEQITAAVSESVASAALSAGVTDLQAEIKGLSEQVVLISSLVRSLQLESLRRSERQSADIAKLQSTVSTIAEFLGHMSTQESQPGDYQKLNSSDSSGKGITVPVIERSVSPSTASVEQSRGSPILKRTDPKSRAIGISRTDQNREEGSSTTASAQSVIKRVRRRE